MSMVSKSTRTPLLAALLVLIVLAVGFGYYYEVTSSALSSNSSTITSLTNQVSSQQGQIQSIQANLTRSQNLANAKASINVVVWLASSTDTSSTYQVRVTNNNHFDVTLAQLTLNVVDSAGRESASNTIAPHIVVTAGTSVSTNITVAPASSGAAGASVSAIISTPYGQIIV